MGSRRGWGGAAASFYEARGDEPLWFDGWGGPRGRAGALLSAFARVDAEGLDSADYPLGELAALLAAADQGRLDPEALASAELLWTRTFLTLARDLHQGRVGAEEGGWRFEKEPLEVEALLQAAAGTSDVGALLWSLVPRHPEYAALKEALAELRGRLASGGWPRVSPGPVLSRGDRDERVVELRGRLLADGELELLGAGDPTLFDAEVEAALRRFQERHGLIPDGILGPESQRALDASPRERIDQLVLNLERLRWLPDGLGERHVWVNVPAFRLEARAGGESVLTSPVIVGRDGWHTPMYSADIVGVRLNPPWFVPDSIAVDSVIPNLLEDPGWARRVGIHAKERGSGQVVEPARIDWASADPGEYRFIQRPGPRNPLGEARFLMPSPYAIFLHGTPKEELFELPRRALSHGCIRVRELEALGRFVLGEQAFEQEWEAASGRTSEVEAPRSVPVHIVYLTAWVDEDGRLRTAPDIYGRDAALLELLDRP